MNFIKDMANKLSKKEKRAKEEELVKLEADQKAAGDELQVTLKKYNLTLVGVMQYMNQGIAPAIHLVRPVEEKKPPEPLEKKK